MRELRDTEVGQVAGGYIFSPTNLAAATQVVRGLGYLGAAFSAGYTIGTALYENGLDEMIADAMR
ncbi:MAG: hypothetical protein OQK99_13310 [Gammaproteobacteria bacterium]|jgi:hypothetical protein|nr:hypothetical protein [Gammaproteobacteria bacterium]